PYALHNIAERLLEAIARGLWENPGADKDALEALLLDAEGAIEDALIPEDRRQKTEADVSPQIFMLHLAFFKTRR
ncbi:MAG: hypothetical protein LBO79_02195, partial [Zoogloeaceae bacterium]|nr:hypothetical protein [Zoogloeaceae bacterium]